MDFNQEIERLKAELTSAERELAELEDRAAQYSQQTQDCRNAIQGLRQALEGKIGGRGRGKGGERVLVNDSTGRPRRGARRKQVELICKRLGRNGRAFRTINVVREMQHIEGGISEGMKSYVYAVLTTLCDKNAVERVGRGTWKLT
jgi:chromosome segregation ATPase